jgi:hypothetical protein
MVTEEDIRRVALALPGSAEKPCNRLPYFRVRGELFLRLHELPDAFFIPCGSLEERDELLEADPGTFFITPHYEGYPGVLVRLSAPKRMLAAYDAEHPPPGDRKSNPALQNKKRGGHGGVRVIRRRQADNPGSGRRDRKCGPLGRARPATGQVQAGSPLA